MKKYIFLSFIHVTTALSVQQTVTTIIPKSYATNDARKIVGVQSLHHWPTDSIVTTSITAQASKTFHPNYLLESLFGQRINSYDVIVPISGSQTTNRSIQRDWLADYFGLPTNFSSTISFRPRVVDFVLESNTIIQLEKIFPGFFIQLNIPLVHTNWNLNTRETITDPGTAVAEGYFSSKAVDRENLSPSFLAFVQGDETPTFEDVEFQPLTNAKFSSHGLKKTQCAELHMRVGYQDSYCDYFSWTVAAQAGIPFSNRPEGTFIFEPIVGNGHHHELGVHGNISTAIWYNDLECQEIRVGVYGTITHLFSTKQRRSFDLKNKSNSRYMLTQQLTSDVTNNLSTTSGNSNTQFNGILSPLANHSTFNVDVKTAYQAEGTILLSYFSDQHSCWQCGYSFYKRSSDKISLQSNQGKTDFNEKKLALKGDAQIYGFIAEQPNINDVPIATAVALSASQSRATIFSGTNFPKKGVSQTTVIAEQQIIDAKKNPFIDTPESAFAGNNQRLVASTNDLSLENAINSSTIAKTITFDDIDIDSARTKAFTHKLFSHLEYHWYEDTVSMERSCGFGAEIDFGPRPGRSHHATNTAFSRWSVWVKGALLF